MFDMAEKMATMFINYMEVFEGKARNVEEFTTLMDTIEKDFTRTNEFIHVSLMILGKKANLPWCKSLLIKYFRKLTQFLYTYSRVFSVFSFYALVIYV